MADETLTIYGTPSEVTIPLTGLANGDAAVSAAISAATGTAYFDRFLFQMTVTGNASSAPTDDTLISVYLSRKIGSLYDGNIPDPDTTGHVISGDAEVENMERTCEALKAVAVQGDATSEAYITSYLVDTPGPTFALTVSNHTAQALLDGTMTYYPIANQYQAS